MFDRGAQLLWGCSRRQCDCRRKPKVRVAVKVEGITGNRDGDFVARLVAHDESFPFSLQTLQFCIGWRVNAPGLQAQEKTRHQRREAEGSFVDHFHHQLLSVQEGAGIRLDVPSACIACHHCRRILSGVDFVPVNSL